MALYFQVSLHLLDSVVSALRAWQTGRGNLMRINAYTFLQAFEIRNEQPEFRDKGPNPLCLSLTSLQYCNLQ